MRALARMDDPSRRADPIRARFTRPDNPSARVPIRRALQFAPPF